MVARAQIFRMATPGHLCPFGIKAKALLEKEGMDVEDHPLETEEAVEHFKAKEGVRTTPQVYIGGHRIGGYAGLRKHLGLADSDSGWRRYQAIIAVFSIAALMTLALSWAMPGSLLTFQSVEWFVALSMCILALLKFQDIGAFTNQFIGYDLLARHVLGYAYLYPFAEAFVGIGMLAGVQSSMASTAIGLVALCIGGIGAVSVLKAVYIDRRELKCACVGGNADVPLGFVSLTENLMMLSMGAWMLLS